jgi:hypothetical protein
MPCGDVDTVRLSAHKTVSKVYDTAAKAALVQQLEVGMDAGG